MAYGRIIVRSTSASEEPGDANGEEREFVLDGRDVAVGRSPSCDVALSGDQIASRRHALLRFKSDRYTIVDLGSSNGTYVNDDEIREETELRDGDNIRIGAHEILYSTAPASPHASLAGVGLSQPLPHAPLSETNPSMEAVEVSQQPAPDGPSGDEQSAEVSYAGTPQVGEADEADEAPALAPDAFAVAADEEQIIALNGASAEQAPASEAEDAASAPAHDQSGTEGTESVSAMSEQDEDEGGSDELETLRMQLSEISTALAQRAEESARAAERLRSALAEVRDQLQSAIGASLGDAQPASAEDTSELITIVRQAAENPRHLDYVTRLAERASDIADALEARPAAEPDATLRATAEGLIARLDQLLA